MATHLNIIVIEDNDDLRETMVDALRGQGHQVVGLDCAEALPEQSAWQRVDIMVVDLNLPGEDGLSLVARARSFQPDVGIIMVTARNRPEDRQAGYSTGADIYLTKPISLPELSAALRSFARRRVATLKHISPQGLTLNKLELQGQQATVKLTAQEAIILTALARAPAGRLETWQIADLLEAQVDESFKASLAVRMVRLRKKLTDAGIEGLAIESLRNIGYQLTTRIQIL